jgi:hypothetical protein
VRGEAERIYQEWLTNRRALDQGTHEAINAMHYPGTRQLCCRCDEPTGRCEDDSIYLDDEGPLCETCRDYSQDALDPSPIPKK